MELPPVKPRARWSRDTEIAFLLALRMTGRVRNAAERIGRSVAAAHQRRQRYPEFAAAWDSAIEEHQADWLDAMDTIRRDPAPQGRERFDGWTGVRRAGFLKVLGESGCVTEACRRVGISTAAAYRLRERDARFAAAWDAALAASAEAVEHVAWRRAVEGWEEPIVAGGAVIGTRRRYSDALLALLALLVRRADALAGPGKGPGGRALSHDELVERTHAAARAAGGAFHPPGTEEKTNAALMRKLERLRLTSLSNSAERDAREWERWQRCWAAAGPLGTPARAVH